MSISMENRLSIPEKHYSMKRKLVLASASPYRKKLLKDVGLDFSVLHSGVDESLQPLQAAQQYAKELSIRKAQAVAARCHDAVVIAADTICSIQGKIIGKPQDEEAAVHMIQHASQAGLQQVITGVTLIDSRDMLSISKSVISLVEMRPIPLEVIRAYVKSGEPMGKCGALCIEGNHQFIKRIEGSYSNIMGLPLEWLLPALAAMTERL